MKFREYVSESEYIKEDWSAILNFLSGPSPFSTEVGLGLLGLLWSGAAFFGKFVIGIEDGEGISGMIDKIKNNKKWKAAREELKTWLNSDTQAKELFSKIEQSIKKLASNRNEKLQRETLELKRELKALALKAESKLSPEAVNTLFHWVPGLRMVKIKED